MLQIQSPFQQLFDTNGSPLDDGYVYIGTANTNPETSPIAIYWDDAGTIPAAQPLRTLNGYIVRSGTPARVYTALEDFSMTVKDKQGRVVFSVLDATSLSNLQNNLASSGGSALVGFLQAGTGAVTRTVESKLRESVSVTDFGAVGDGLIDDTAAIQAALNVASSVDFGDYSKNYQVTGQLTVNSNTRIFGNGARIFQASLQTPIFNCNNTTNVSISGLRLTGAQMSIVAAGSFVPGRKYSIVSVGTTSFTSIGASSNTPGVAFTASGAGSGTGTASTFFNSAASNDVAILANYASNLSVTNNVFTGFAYSTLKVGLWGTNVEFSNNTVTGPGATVLNPLAGDPAVTGFRNCTGVTILGRGVKISENTFSGTSQAIILGQQSVDAVIANNVIHDTVVEHGMYIDTGCQHVAIANNVVSNTILCGVKVQWYDVTLAATSILAGGLYVIRSAGTTNFTSIGAASNTVGTVFTATGAGTGSGTVGFVDPSDVTITGNVIENTQYPGGDGILVLNAAPASVASITGITAANPAVFTTAAAHGLVAGDVINISGVVGMLNAASAVGNTVNDLFIVDTTPTGSTFTVKTYTNAVLNTTGWSAYTSGGSITRPAFGKNFTIVGNSLRRISQDGISARFLNNSMISSNAIDVVGRIGLYGLWVGTVSYSNNTISNVQSNGIAAFAPFYPCTIKDNFLINVGLAGVHVGGGSSGILLDGNGGGDISFNNVIGEPTQTKMRNGILLASGDKRQYCIDHNRITRAETAGINLWNDTPNAFSLKSLFNNIAESALGMNVYSGLSTSIPGRGTTWRDFFGNAVPTTGSWIQGDKVWAQTPNNGGNLGWVCVSSGSPGDWAPFGTVRGLNAYTVTNPTTDRALNVTTDTTAQVAAVLGTLIEDLKAAGVLL